MAYFVTATPLVARETDHLIRLSTGALATPPSPAVRNHRIAVRLAMEPLSALHRIPHFHAEQVIGACKAGKKAVLCEKPLAVTRVESAAVRAAAEAYGVPIFVGTMHAYDPAYRAPLPVWRDLGETAMNVSSSIYIPSNDVYIDQATEQLPPAVRQPSAPLVGAAFRQAMMRAAMLGLAILNIPLVRDFQPHVGTLPGARFFPPFGYLLGFTDEEQHSVLTAFVRGDWPSRLP